MPEANTLVLLIIYKLSIIFVIQNWLTMWNDKNKKYSNWNIFCTSTI
jgi:hypothetical protein